MKPEISVIMPLYNKEKTVKRAIDSILAQSFEDFELIIVNDESNDSSREIAACCSDQRIRIIDRENGGSGAARNTGIENANAGLLAFLDADDEWVPLYLQNAYNEMKRANVGIVGTTYYEFPKGIDIADNLGKTALREGIGKISARDNTLSAFERLQFFHVGNSLVKTDLARNVRGFDNKKRNGVDTVFFYKVLANAEYSIITPSAVIHHRDASGLSNKVPSQLPTIFLDPSCILNFCPKELRGKMEEVISYVSLMEARRRARRGMKADAEFLHQSFPKMKEFSKLYSKLQREMAFSLYFKYWTAFKRLLGPPARRFCRERFAGRSFHKLEDVLDEAGRSE
ncbi:putative glycosyltransferase EpsJ [Sedimentisphaera cyanobacteriorum]|uniref:Putative glycosyltransferase EpsJ n=1 Tax=Sedimentisphaera cyanobacteriorum TaxID=1940790 RepID=A0A1Q2HLG2_9BACT|nr:glycosyltransferase family 2 protein [Sedimentisphaera cyanobacteriorum]AQQ08409.1 putative glycosyltransferase EpsJ [Sedimentisphaera cyanobacteriorum]